MAMSTKQRDIFKINIYNQQVNIGQPGTVPVSADSPHVVNQDEIKKAAKKASRIGAFQDMIDSHERSANTSTD